MGCYMERVHIRYLMAASTMGTTLRISEKDTDASHGQMEADTTAIGGMELRMAMESINGLMEVSMMVTMFLTSEMGLAFTHGQTERHTVAIGRMTSSKVRES